jgi:hypothetical protein
MKETRTFDEISASRKLLWLTFAVVTFLFMFYAGTALMSVVYPLDEAVIGF